MSFQVVSAEGGGLEFRTAYLPRRLIDHLNGAAGADADICLSQRGGGGTPVWVLWSMSASKTHPGEFLLAVAQMIEDGVSRSGDWIPPVDEP